MSDRPASGTEEEIKVAPEMLSAGASVLMGFETETCGEAYWAEEVYIAMERARLRKPPAATL